MKLAAVCLFLLSLCGVGMAQPVVISGNASYNADSPYNRLYNTRTVITIKGKVTGRQIAPPMKGMTNAVTFIVRDAKGKNWQVDVGPEWYVNNQHTRIQLKDSVQVTGSRVTIDGHDVILAEEIVKAKSVLALRRPAGRPYWDAIFVETPADVAANQKVVYGPITAIDTFNDGTNGPTERLTVQTDDGSVQVALAPTWYMQRQALQFALGEHVNVYTWAPVGVATTPAGIGLAAPPIVFATTLGLGQQWMVLRTSGGSPMWFGPGGN